MCVCVKNELLSASVGLTLVVLKADIIQIHTCGTNILSGKFFFEDETQLFTSFPLPRVNEHFQKRSAESKLSHR